MVCKDTRMRNIKNSFTAFLNEYTFDSTMYWYPLCSLRKKIDVVAYQMDSIYKNGDIGQIENALRAYGIECVISVQMQGRGDELHEVDLYKLLYKKDRDGYTFPWNIETYYFDDSREWMIYVSHEGTITFTGKRLVKCAKENISGKYLYV